MGDARRLLVGGAVLAAVTASLGLFAASDAPSLPALASVTAAPTAPAAKAAALRIDLLERRALEPATGALFAAQSWQPPPRPPAAPKAEAAAPPPAPAAPPLPFTFLGAFEAAGGKPVFYLVEGDKVHAVSAGDKLNDLYGVEALDAQGMVLVYLPLGIRQTLAFEGKK